MTEAAIRLSGIHKSFGAHHVLRGIDLQARNGEVISIIGGSGSGKSTLLRCVPLLEQPDSGQIAVGDDSISLGEPGQRLTGRDRQAMRRLRSQLGFVFQNFNLWPHMTALQNVMELPLHVQKRPRAECREEAEALLERVGLTARRDAWPSQLSGGQQQRVAIARALAVRPRALLFDEPTSALDPELVGEVLTVIRALAEEGRTMVLVTHEMGFARHVSHRAIYLHDGRIEEEGPPEQVFDNPLSERCRRFVSHHLSRN
ncbi:ATP-binding cassette domain-containing protein [Acidisoma cellulosilytica]|uniref:ATP-binding cassette domain-containing protein n=1 Tax=Acidisoma cellulosilyticum TaxID=2802395 RepID=A0A963Z3M6_9PROT|nr:ATP-binding cassette domain-containing protein [Acidisoma cellulosilyticum]MCB8882148.1 ATP-binding cassette domain-containing protein [Acidisoma cellulosilyticum]